jgi:hypothetical protein
LGVLWAEEDLPLAVALQMKRGATIYRDVWFDKPPLVPAVYLLWGAAIGLVLRIAGAIYGLVACALAYAIASRLWTRREGYIAAALLGFFLTFDTHSAVLPLAADLLLLVPHLAAVLLAIQKRPLWSGVAAGIGFLFNAKAIFVLGACALFAWPAVIPLLAGFAIPNLIAAAWLSHAGALAPYFDQVWRWPAQYAGSPVVANPIANGVIRTVNWLGFHAALVIGAVCLWARAGRWKFIAWALLCFAGVALGWRFFPRYFFLLLPPMVIACAGCAPTFLRYRAVAALALLSLAVPLVRFAPRYILLQGWNDLALDRDSREASAIVTAHARPDATLYVWGYRPEIFVYTRLRPATRYLECQAMTGVPADRHLTQSKVVLTAGTHEAREELARSKPTILVDGLSLFNPALSISHYEELRPWLARYREIGRTRETIVYAAVTSADGLPSAIQQTVTAPRGSAH